ncbi:hypothetical protein BOTBODRAFT_451425 [Botryobasidium botryosum FD-172 SS1]|uniref:RING-type domain-containing protein n=1 Tax=Botryobasidium botryosum (strain FD-172 SS1) TaxID=930990 RepID=A0A067MIX5_BOTB1|nr:hypothetical protein BOTBODRAFT_451425 [Botryobasidium botryosum FD-172 SS1]
MLTLDPSSACPVCAKKYHPELLPPYLTTCGHTFCLPCLQDLDAPKCPTCHDTLQITRVRQVHIDVARSDSAGHSHVRRKEPPVRPPDAVLEVVRDLEYKLAKALGRSHEDTLRACNEVQDWIEKADATYAHEKLVLLTFSDLALKRVEFERAPPSADTKKIEDLMAMVNKLYTDQKLPLNPPILVA